MFKVFVRSVLDYASPCWNPYLQYQIDTLERIQGRFLKRVPQLHRFENYRERLEFLKMDLLEIRRLKTDLITTFKVLHGFLNIPIHDFFCFAPIVGTRGTVFKLTANRTKLDIRKYFFSVRIVNIWNKLGKPPYDSLNIHYCTTVKQFKSKMHMLEIDFFREFLKTSYLDW